MQLTEQQAYIRDRLSKKSKTVKAEQFAKEIGVTDMAVFIKDLNALEREGEILLSKKGGITSVAGAGLVRGKIVSASRHFVFMHPDDGGEDVYISMENNIGALPGDRVIISRYADEKGFCGKVRSVFAYSDRTVVGTVKKFRGKWELHPDTMYRVPIELEKNNIGAQEGDKIQAKVRFSKDGRKMTCSAVKLYGEAESARVCADAIIDALGIPTVFPEEVLASAKEINAGGVTPEDIEGREDLRQMPIFTIDGADAKDLDDAICVRRVGDGFELSVHIADVSHYVKGGSPLDLEALERGTSVYFADRVIPMYPEAVSNGICSLNAHTDKLCFSAFMEFDGKGQMRHYRFAKTVIDSKVRGVYSEVNAILHGTASDEINEKYACVRETVADAYELYQILSKTASERGSIRFSSTESRFELDENGVCCGIFERESGEAERMIEQFMIAANVAAARLAKRAQLPFVYRVHESPDPEALERVAKLLRVLGIHTAALGGDPSPAEVDAVLTEVKDSPFEEIVSNVLLRAMAKARYDSNPLGHYGLALDDYCHFTSPIRRYPDSFIHRVLSAYVSGEGHGSMVKRYYGKAMDAAERSTECEVRAVTAERRSEDCYMAEYMAKFVGQEFDGVISHVFEGGFFVRLTNSAEGMVHFDDLPYDEYEYDGLATLKGVLSGRSYRVGDSVRIKVAAARIATGKVSFVLAGDDSTEQY